MNLRHFTRITLIVLLLSSNSFAQPFNKPGRSKNLHGKEAIAALGERLPAKALQYRMSAAQLEKLFHEDESLNLDDQERLLYVDMNVPTDNGPTAPGSESVDGVISTENVFLLNSKPGSLRTIYLDFDGATLTGTAWNATIAQDPYEAPAYDIDGVPATFSDVERQRIIGMWRRVAEDFAAFDVNITTQKPSPDLITRTASSDQTYGTTALITRAFPVCNGGTSCGGVAYYNAFGSTSEYTKPALVFFDKLGGGDEKYTAEAISHEVGHNLGLQHDGTLSGSVYYAGHGSGETGWAPIMGNGYYQPVTQWSKGEYNDANNPQDDFVTMQGLGLNFRSDDYGNTMNSATQVDQGATFGLSGIIGSSSDVDFFKFNAGVGEVTIDVITAATGPNLDLQITVYDAAGQVLGTVNPSTTLKASLAFSSQASGTYYLSVEGVGYATPATGFSDYSSLGRYTVVGTLTDSRGNQAPYAMATASTTSGTAPLAITFDGTGSADPDGSITSYSWFFSDGTTATGVTVQHTFTSVGTHTATLTVVDNGGLSAGASVTISVNLPPNQPPVARFSSSTTSGTIPHAITFNGSTSTDSDGSISSYEWTFADGGTATGVSVSHTFLTAGDLVVTLKVTDNSGASSTAQATIHIIGNPGYIAPPTGMAASLLGTSVNLSWSDNSGNESGFRVERRKVTTSGSGKNRTTTYSAWETVATTGINQSSASNVVALDGSVFDYQTRAYNSNGLSAPSNIVQIKSPVKRR